eukprot:GHVP01009116.1.p1 GENE.GHVP01009116.1~~GHVP01009116.1.p1  ORF type:complete len:371 (+),score=89.78 GHVP01009116.1:74-1114(+)
MNASRSGISGSPRTYFSGYAPIVGAATTVIGVTVGGVAWWSARHGVKAKAFPTQEEVTTPKASLAEVTKPKAFLQESQETKKFFDDSEEINKFLEEWKDRNIFIWTCNFEKKEEKDLICRLDKFSENRMAKELANAFYSKEEIEQNCNSVTMADICQKLQDWEVEIHLCKKSEYEHGYNMKTPKYPNDPNNICLFRLPNGDWLTDVTYGFSIFSQDDWTPFPFSISEFGFFADDKESRKILEDSKESRKISLTVLADENFQILKFGNTIKDLELEEQLEKKIEALKSFTAANAPEEAQRVICPKDLFNQFIQPHQSLELKKSGCGDYWVEEKSEASSTSEASSKLS